MPKNKRGEESGLAAYTRLLQSTVAELKNKRRASGEEREEEQRLRALVYGWESECAEQMRASGFFSPELWRSYQKLSNYFSSASEKRG